MIPLCCYRTVPERMEKELRVSESEKKNLTEESLNLQTSEDITESTDVVSVGKQEYVFCTFSTHSYTQNSAQKTEC